MTSSATSSDLTYFNCLAAALGLMLAALTPAHAETKRALLVTIDAYPKVTDKRIQLKGAKVDMQKMRVALKGYGFPVAEIHELTQNLAKAPAIRTQLDQLARDSSAGDVTVFYFSGRGSVAARSAGGLQGSLVPWEELKTPDSAIPMSDVVAWANKVKGKGATPVVILDACFTNFAKSPPQGRVWRDAPKVVTRRDLAGTLNWEDPPGIFLLATTPKGRAYVWDASAGDWRSAFTDLFANGAVKMLHRGEKATYASVMDTVGRFFSATRDFQMPNQQPLLCAGETLSKLPLFGGAPAESATEVKAEIEQAIKEQRDEERTLRVSVYVSDKVLSDGGAQTEEERDKAREADRERIMSILEPVVKSYVEQHLDHVTYVKPLASRIDRVVALDLGDGGVLQLRVLGGETAEVMTPHPRLTAINSAAIDRALAKGPGDYLQLQGYYLRLFRMAAVADKEETLKPGLSAKSEKESYRVKQENEPRDWIYYNLELPQQALTYILDQDQDGKVDMVWPTSLSEHRDNLVKAGSARIPFDDDRPIVEDGNTPLGLTITRAMIVSAEPGVIPPLYKDAGADWDPMDTRFLKLACTHYKALLDAIDAGKAKWSAKSFTFEVKR